jgi:hypothetical protein
MLLTSRSRTYGGCQPAGRPSFCSSHLSWPGSVPSWVVVPFSTRVYVIIGTIVIIAACIGATWSAAFRPEDKGHRHCGCYQRCHRRRPSRSDGSTGVRDGRTGVRGGSTGVRGGVTGVSGAWSCASGDRRGGGITRSRAGGLIGEDRQGLPADDGARRGVPHRRVRNWRGADRQRGGVARTRSPGPGDGDGREHVPRGRALRQGR